MTVGRFSVVAGYLRAKSPAIGLSVTWVFLATWLQLVRTPGRPSWNNLWAEDGGVFLSNAYQHALADNLFRPHAGYYQVIARLVAQPAAHMPVSWAAAWMATASATVVALSALIVWNRSAAVLRHGPARMAVTLLVPLMPQVAYEVTNAAADVHWYLIYVLFWVVVTPPTSVPGCVTAAAFGLLAGLSDPLATLMLIPGLVGWWIWGRPPRALAGPAGLLLAGLAQFHLQHHVNYVYRLDTPDVYAARVALSSVTGDRLLTFLYPALGMGAAWVAVGVLAAVIAGLLRRNRPRSTVLGAVCLLMSVLYLAVELVLRNPYGILSRTPFSLNSSRYTVVPLWLLFTGIILLADGKQQSGARLPRPVRMPLALLVVVAWLGAETLSDWSEPSVRSHSPAWSTQVANAKRSCEYPPAQRNRAIPVVYEGQAGPDDVVIPIAPIPSSTRPFFGLIVSCRRLRG